MKISQNRKTKLHVLYCSNCLQEKEVDCLLSEDTGCEYTVISLPCSGKVDLLYLLKAFETGADGLVMVTCAKKECHYLEGNLRAPKRIEQANALLEEAGMGKDRLALFHLDEKGIEDIIGKIKAFALVLSAEPPIVTGNADTEPSAVAA